jgi:hypothetical protein
VLSLGVWVMTQLNRYNGVKGQSELRDDQREMLEHIPAFRMRIEDRLVGDLFVARAVVDFCKRSSSGRLPTWRDVHDHDHTNITRKMTGRYCDTLKVKFSEGRLTDEAQLVLSGVKAWVEWVEWSKDPLKDNSTRYEFNARAVADFFKVEGRFPSPEEEWKFSHSGVDGTAAGRWWNGQKYRYRNRINVNAVVRCKAEIMSEEQDRQLDEWIGEPWKVWKSSVKSITAILRYKELQGDAWDGTVSENFVVSKGGEEGSEHWHEELQGMEVGQIASSISSGARTVEG